MSDDDNLLSSSADVGECGIECQSSLVIDAEGTITYTKFGSLEIQDTTDVATLRDIISATNHDLITGEDDCGREVDGTASVLTVAGTKIDLCYVTVDKDHQLMVYLQELHKELNSDLPDLHDLEETEGWNPFGYNQTSDTSSQFESTPTIVDPAECPEGEERSTYDFGSYWILIRKSDEGFCDVWFGGEEENPNYDGSPHQYCHLPIQHKPVTIEGAGETTAGSINSLWCQDSSQFRPWKNILTHSKPSGEYPFGVQVIEDQDAFESFLEEIEYDEPLPKVDFGNDTVIAFARHHGSSCEPTFRDLEIDETNKTIKAVYDESSNDVCPANVVGHATVLVVNKVLFTLPSYEILSPVPYLPSATYRP